MGAVNAAVDTPLPALRDLVASKRVAMLATVSAGRLVSRPVTTLEVEGADTLWFMIARDSSIAAEIGRESQVCLSYVPDGQGAYLSVRGEAALTRDRARIEALWNPAYAAWFDGPDDPALALLRVTVAEVELWDTPSTTVGKLFALARAVATGDASALATHARGAPPAD
jgi:general stress protein 26